MQLMKLIPKSVSRQALLTQKNSPKILFGVGVAGVIGSTVLACWATLKLDEVITEMDQDLDIARALEHSDYSEQDRSRDIAIIYARGAGSIAKLYAPSLILGAASFGALTKSHNILQERNVALTAAYAAVDKAFNRYRERVVEKYGEEEDRELRYESEEVEVIDSEGKKAKLIRAAPGASSMYARFFDQYSTSWSKEPEYNLVFLQCQQSYANDMLRARGHIFLNEVYDSLGIERSKAGAVVGWIVTVLADDPSNYGTSLRSLNSETVIHLI